MGIDDELDELAASSLPLYTKAEAARILGVSSSTFNNWTTGYKYSRGGRKLAQPPIITVTDELFGLSVPFDGLAEAFVLMRLREAGVPMQRIRPAVAQLSIEMGLQKALLSERLKTDGAVVLFEYLYRTDDDFDPAPQLTEVVSKQAVFKVAVQDYLQTITYGADRIQAIRLDRAGPAVSIDPRINGGQPSLTDYGLRVSDVVGRFRAGESVEAIADDYEIPLEHAQVLVNA